MTGLLTFCNAIRSEKTDKDEYNGVFPVHFVLTVKIGRFIVGHTSVLDPNQAVVFMDQRALRIESFDRAEFSAVLRSLLSYLYGIGMNSSQIAEKVGVSRAVVGAWKAGTHFPSPENLQLLHCLCAKKFAENLSIFSAFVVSEASGDLAMRWPIRPWSGPLVLDAAREAREFLAEIDGLLDESLIGASFALGETVKGEWPENRQD